LEAVTCMNILLSKLTVVAWATINMA
jgi:hypothetical protein